MLGNDFQKNKNIVSSDLNDGLIAWYEEILSGDYDYIAALTRRCTNVLACFLEEGRLSLDNSKAMVLTENGLFKETDAIAEYYINSAFKALPKIAVIDDILVHGRSLNLFLTKLLELIQKIIADKGFSCDVSELQKAFYRSITICIYAINSSPILLKQEYLLSLQYSCMCIDNEWTEISRQLSDKIWKSKVANTSYIISAFADLKDFPNLNKQAEKNSHWSGLVVPAAGSDEAGLELYVHTFAERYNVFPTVRLYERDSDKLIIPYLFTSDLSNDQVMKIEKWILSRLRHFSREVTDKIADILEQTRHYEERMSVYFQFIELLMSQIVLNVFLSDLGLSVEKVGYDIKKISPNFGSFETIKPMLDYLCSIGWIAEDLEILCSLAATCERTDKEKKEKNINNISNGAVIRSSGDQVIYEQAIKHESNARMMETIYGKGGEVDSGILHRTGECSVNDYMNQVEERTKLSVFSLSDRYAAIGDLTLAMDRGRVSLKSRYRKDPNGNYVFYSAVRNTELSLFIMPEKLGEHFSQFAYFADFFWDDKNFPEEVKKYFGKALPDDDPNKKEHTDIAVYMAEQIRDNQSIAGAMLNWDNIM